MKSKSPSVVVDTRQSAKARFRPIPLDSITFGEGFWKNRQQTIRNTSLKLQFEECEKTGRLENFRIASGRRTGTRSGLVFNDSDVYKLLEAASWALASESDEVLEQLIDTAIDEIAAAQQSNGYLNTAFMFDNEGLRYTDLKNDHELYCYGHMIQAAIAHKRSTGKETFFDIAIRVAQHLLDTFGPGKLESTDGHEEIELALVELYRETGTQEYLNLAHFFLSMRGQSDTTMTGGENRVHGTDRSYFQDHLPVSEQHEADGHAVRLTYLASGMADVELEGAGDGMQSALDSIWDSAHLRRSSVTGGIGARYQGEAFGDDYELPNERAYNETCASLGSIFWNWRMLNLTGEAKYAEVIERQLFNGALSGLSIDGTGYFYMNPLTSAGGYSRTPWFTCACCPPNIARLMMSLASYFYSEHDQELWIHQYASGSVQASGLSLAVNTDYPWSGDIRVTVTANSTVEHSILLRVPEWATNSTVVINNESAISMVEGTYHRISRKWSPGDTLAINFPIGPRRIYSHPRITNNSGRVSLARGPLIYCLESADQTGSSVFDLALAPNTEIAATYDPNLLGGLTLLKASGTELERTSISSLYSDSRTDQNGSKPKELIAIPYYAWGNRGDSQMQVWIPEK